MHESFLNQAPADAQNAKLPLPRNGDVEGGDAADGPGAERAYRRVMRRVGESERAPTSLVARALQLLRVSRGERS